MINHPTPIPSPHRGGEPTENKVLRSALPLLQRRQPTKRTIKTKKIMTKKETFKWIVQIIASVATAILTALGATSCMGY